MASRAKAGPIVGACLLSCFAGAISSKADEINLEEQITKKIGPAGMARLTADAKCGQRPFNHDCFGIRFRNVHILPIRIDYSDVKPTAIPEDIVGETFNFRNCSATERNDQRTTEMKFIDGYTITKTDSVTNTLGANVNLEIYGQKLGVNNTDAVSFTTTEALNHAQERTETVNTNEKLRPYTDLFIKVEKRVSHAYLDFSGVVEVQGDVVMAMSGGAHGWDFPLGRLSDWMTDKQIALRGQIWNARAEATTKTIHEVGYTAETCPPGDPVAPATLTAVAK